MAKQYQVKITTLTPVCIGDGQRLSPFSDYKLKRDKLIYLNQEVIKKALEKQPDLIDDYVEGIISGMDNTGSKFDIDSFLYNRAKLDLSSLKLKEVDSTAQPKGNKNLYTILKQVGKYPYIPGSSLKGAIKTALLYNWLMDKNNYWCKDYLKLLDKNSSLTQEELKDKKIEFEDIFDNQLEKFEFAVSDSDIFPENSIKAIDTKRLHLKEGKFTIPQTWEAIKENCSATITINSIKENKDKLLNWSEICKIVNSYTLNSNDREWEIFNSCGAENNKFDVKLNDIKRIFYKFYKKSEDDINKADETACYLRLGSGKGYYFNSIGLALYNADKTNNKVLFYKFLKQMKFKSSKKYRLHATEFPLTRVLDLETYNPLGWVKLELLKEKEL
ncbi:MAG TPA: type III-A CRISPR-associated RAMP protein Csm5 [Bacteroidales bacterium]|nr:type III-A CRISPR-associated RAMP protein Csm5 [Bacteroidales bacterium]